jgi:hypothetical protein
LFVFICHSVEASARSGSKLLTESNVIPKSRTCYSGPCNRRLVNHKAGQKRIAIVFQGDGQAARRLAPEDHPGREGE